MEIRVRYGLPLPVELGGMFSGVGRVVDGRMEGTYVADCATGAEQVFCARLSGFNLF